MKKQIKNKHENMLNIIEMWKKKASEQGFYWSKMVRDMKIEHERSEIATKTKLRTMEDD